ncbi:MAG: dynamin family protein, partial [Acetobacterium sp.]|uniref:dynamin family protein n=1 Tax=Acetobacterium sp. TaxID=1872094 RepID=UPI003242C537
MFDELVDLLSQLDDVTKTYFDLLGTESESLIRENQIESVEKINKYLKALEDENRLLQIGIIGRVKAGKSSLINALLFDGKDILPKAATPMTAALTELSYGEALSAEVEFYTKDDIDKIEEYALRYKREEEELVKKELEEYKKRNGKGKPSQELS